MSSGDYFISDKLPNKLAIKGNCRNSKVGGEKCSKDTVIYEVTTKYYGKRDGESSFSPLFVIAAMLECVNIAINEIRYIKLNY